MAKKVLSDVEITIIKQHLFNYLINRGFDISSLDITCMDPNAVSYNVIIQILVSRDGVSSSIIFDCNTNDVVAFPSIWPEKVIDEIKDIISRFLTIFSK